VNWPDLDIGSNSYGEYTFEAGSPNSDISNDSVSGVMVDEANPKVDSTSPEGYINDDSPTVSIEASDSASGMDSVELSVDGDGVDESADGTDSAEIDLSGLSDGSYDVSATLTDEVGNERTEDWEFTVDTEYEGDTNPEVSPEPGVFRSEGDDMRIEFLVDGSDDENSEVTATCEYQGGEITSSNLGRISDDESENFNCDLDTESYYNMAVDLSLKLEDEAGNEWTQNIGDYVFDFSKPTISDLSAVVGVFNDDFEISYEASDSGGDLNVDRIHYQIDNSDFDSEEGVNVSEVDGDFNVDTEGLEAGEHTVYAWAVDEAGRVSESSSFGFDFRPDAEPSAEIGVSDSLSVAAGDSETISVNVTNTGELFVGKMDLTLTSEMINQSRTLRDMKPEDRKNSLFSIDTSEEDLGVHTLELSTESPDASETVRFTVEANSEQEDRINSEYNEYIEKYEALKENVSKLNGEGLSDSREERLEGNTSEFFSDMEEARSAKESGDLYRVDAKLAGISTDFETASSSYEQVKTEHEEAERSRFIGMLLLLFVGIGGSGVAYATLFSDQYYLDMEALKEEFEFMEGPVETIQTTMDQYELDLSPVEGLVERVGELLAEEEKEIEEAEQQAFQGFT